MLEPGEVLGLFLPPPPQAAAMSARPTTRAVAVNSHFHRFLRFNSVTSPVLYRCRAKTTALAALLSILTDVEG